MPASTQLRTPAAAVAVGRDAEAESLGVLDGGAQGFGGILRRAGVGAGG